METTPRWGFRHSASSAQADGLLAQVVFRNQTTFRILRLVAPTKSSPYWFPRGKTLKPERNPGYLPECLSLWATCFIASTYRSVSSRIAAHPGAMKWSSNARPRDRPGRGRGSAYAYCSGKSGGRQGRKNRSMVLDHSPYPWDFAALQSRRTIVLRPGVQRSSPCACEQR